MKYLDDNESVTVQELLDSCKTAYASYIDATAAHAADAYTDDYPAAAAIASAVATAAHAACVYAITTAAADAHYAKNTIDRYFNFAGENKQDYINEIARNKGE